MFPSKSERRNDPGLDLLATKYGPSHFGSNLPELSVCGLHKNTISPISKAFSFTFLSLQAFVSD
jgi:hypothetical protein